MRTRGAARMEREALEINQTRSDKDSPLPPESSRVAPQLFSPFSSSSGTRPILRPAQRVLLETRLVAKPEELQLHDIDVKPSPSFSQHEMGLDGISQPAKDKDRALDGKDIQEQFRNIDVIQSSQSAIGLLHCSKKSRTDEMELTPVTQVEGIPRKSTTNNAPTSSAHSLNLTEFARGLIDGSDDDDSDEVDSYPAYELVNGHRVKKEIAPLAQAMFRRYGNITHECTVKSPKIISFMLESLCDVYQKLEQRKLHDLTRSEIDSMMDELHFIEAHKVDVSWLLEKLQQISETKARFHKYLMAKDVVAEDTVACEDINRSIETYRRHMLFIEKRIAEAEKSKAQSETKLKESKQMALEIKSHLPSVKDVKSQSLVDGIL